MRCVTEDVEVCLIALYIAFDSIDLCLGKLLWFLLVFFDYSRAVCFWNLDLLNLDALDLSIIWQSLLFNLFINSSLFYSVFIFVDNDFVVEQVFAMDNAITKFYDKL